MKTSASTLTAGGWCELADFAALVFLVHRPVQRALSPTPLTLYCSFFPLSST